MTVPEPNYPPLSTREIQALPEGARVIVTWAEGNAGPNEYQQRAADHLVTATQALVRVTSRLGIATWVLVALTAVLAVSATIPLLGLGR